jgi:hypothetical protein
MKLPTLILVTVGAVWVCVMVWALRSNAEYERKHPCIRSHTEKVWYQPPPLHITVGEDQWIDVPQVGYWMDDTVCDEREGVLNESRR